MKTIEEFKKDEFCEINLKQLANIDKRIVAPKVYMHIKRLFYITSFIGVGLLLNSCIGGYIATEPLYVESSRPPQPSNLHIWIDGDWFWSGQSRTYVQRNGYWTRSRPNHSYVTGYWQSSPKGRYWKSGHWQRQKTNRNKHNR